MLLFMYQFRPQAKPPPTQFRRSTEHGDLYMWYITKDEYLRLNKIFGRDFQECNTGGTLVVGLPSPCEGCGKYTEFIDWSVYDLIIDLIYKLWSFRL